MKTAIVIAAALGLSATGALAECAGHTKTTASADVDRTLTTASIVKASDPARDDAVTKTGSVDAKRADAPAVTE